MRLLVSRARSLLLLLLVATSRAAGPASVPRIDLGWLRATQNDQGWLLTYVYEGIPTRDALRSGDVLVSVDHQRLEELNPLGVAHVMTGIGSAHTAVVYRNQATVRLNFVSLDERVISLPRRRFDWPTQIYARGTPPPSLALPDPNNLVHNVAFREKWTLLHLWSAFCDIGLDALNEMANPEPSDLHIVGIELGHHVQDVRGYMSSRGLSFFTLVAEDTATFSQIYDPSISDILIDAEGRIVFMGAGGDSLRTAYLLYRSQSARQAANR